MLGVGVGKLLDLSFSVCSFGGWESRRGGLLAEGAGGCVGGCVPALQAGRLGGGGVLSELFVSECLLTMADTRSLRLRRKERRGVPRERYRVRRVWRT